MSRPGGHRTWRRAVLVRDDGICRACGDEDAAELHGHHLRTWASTLSTRFAVSNGVALCKVCHVETHRGHKRRETFVPPIYDLDDIPLVVLPFAAEDAVSFGDPDAPPNSSWGIDP